ncbi:MAG TPA: SRPBCC domain-containing protein [Kofleriaceae bacterium]|jgi:hypothetical protein
MIQDSVKVTTFVAVPQAKAFAVFTDEIEAWWQRGPRFRAVPAKLVLEPRLGGRIFHQGDAGPLHELGTITAWSPPSHFAFTWRAINFAPSESTLVSVSFVPSGTGTRVTLEHSGFASLRPDHPVRHGEPPPIFLGRLGRWWGDLLTSYRHIIA